MISYEILKNKSGIRLEIIVYELVVCYINQTLKKFS